MNDQVIEQAVQAKGLTAPRVTLADLNANIADIEIVKHISKSGQVLRWAILTAQNGFAAVGKPSVAASPDNDNAEIGEKVAIDNSRAELWPLMGYALKDRLAVPPVVRLEVVTFEQLVQYGRENGGNIVGGMPWSFNFNGHPVSHENDRCYLVGQGLKQVRFTPDDVLVVSSDGELLTMPADMLEV